MFILSIRCLSYRFGVYRIDSMFILLIRCLAYRFGVNLIDSVFTLSNQCLSYRFGVNHIDSVLILAILCLSYRFGVYPIDSVFILSIWCLAYRCYLVLFLVLVWYAFHISNFYFLQFMCMDSKAKFGIDYYLEISKFYIIYLLHLYCYQLYKNT